MIIYARSRDQINTIYKYINYYLKTKKNGGRYFKTWIIEFASNVKTIWLEISLVLNQFG